MGTNDIFVGTTFPYGLNNAVPTFLLAMVSFSHKSELTVTLWFE